MSELSSEPASLVERLHSFFHVELPGNSELATQYALDPSGTLAEHFADLTPADLDDAVRLVSENTTADYADAAGDAGGSEPQFEGESPFAYAFRANYEPATDGGQADSDLHAVDHGLDGVQDLGAGEGFGSDLQAALDGAPDFGSGLASYAEADPTFGDAGADGDGDGADGDGHDLGPDTGHDAGHDPGDLGELGPDHDADGGEADPSWDGDLHEDPALDAGDGHFDPGLGF